MKSTIKDNTLFRNLFFIAIASVLLILINNNLSNKLYAEALSWNSLVYEKSKLEDSYILCKEFSKNTSYIKYKDCNIIYKDINIIEKKLNEEFKLLTFYIKLKGKFIEIKKKG